MNFELIYVLQKHPRSQLQMEISEVLPYLILNQGLYVARKTFSSSRLPKKSYKSSISDLTQVCYVACYLLELVKICFFAQVM